MTVLFCTEDPRNYKVEAYEGILEYIFKKHAELAGFGLTYDEIQSIVEKPDRGEIFLIKNGVYTGCCSYYRLKKNFRTEIRIIVKYDANNVGEVVDIHPVTKRQSEEKIWPQ